MSEDQLTELQKRWLEASRKIGAGPMTKSERRTLESIYAEMLPQEQKELQAYIQENYGSGEDPDGDGQVPAEPSTLMEAREWAEPSAKLSKALSKAQRSPFNFDGKE